MLVKDFVSQIFNKIKASGSFQVDIAYLKDNSWFHVTEDVLKSKTVFIFKKGGQLLISKDGDITKASWENLIHSTNSLIIEISGKSTLYNIIYLTTEYLVLQKDGAKIVEVFIKQHRYDTQLPTGQNSNPIELIYTDLKELLKKRNKPEIESPIEGEGELISEITTILDNPISSDDLIKLINQEVKNVKNGTHSAASDKVFDKHEILHRIKKHYSVKKDDEINFFSYMQEVEEELKEKEILCATCASLYTIDGGICSVCQEYNFCSNCHLSYDDCQCYGKYGVNPDDKRLMKKYSITYKDEMYYFQQHKYVNFRDAINYAMLCEKKAAKTNNSHNTPR